MSEFLNQDREQRIQETTTELMGRFGVRLTGHQARRRAIEIDDFVAEVARILEEGETNKGRVEVEIVEDSGGKK